MFLPSGQVRFVSKVIEIWRSASIHNEVPVNPRWPKDPGEKYFPPARFGWSVQPSVRVVSAGTSSRFVKMARLS